MILTDNISSNLIIQEKLSPLLKYMDSLTLSKQKLDELSRNWDTLSLLSQLGDAGMNMDKIKNDFSSLSAELVNHLGNELLQKVLNEMNSKAQVSVDIVIRNLFERTADIGFLSTDQTIKEFLLNFPTKYSPGYQENVNLLKKRFQEYAKKYSVYFDLVLMNPQGDILVNIDNSNTAVKSHDPLIAEVLNTSEEYVETYKYHDFIPTDKKTLVYSYKVTQSNDFEEDVLGILCLCFKFENEMDEIFKNLCNPQTKECLTLLNKDGKVIATSDKHHIPLDASLEIILDEAYKIVTFGGRDYLAKSSKTNGYQGFYGLGWYGHVMIPLEYAFSAIDEDNFEITQNLLLAILQHSDLFSDTLKQIPPKAEEIQNNLNRAIWNGNIKQNNSKNDNKQFSKALLQEIKKTGEETKSIIGDSMAKLTKTMVLSDSVFLADLILDIMDRNLYERANDCRWWALTPDFQSILESDTIDINDQLKMNTILTQINNLYTVYTNLFVYNKKGVIVAVSDTSQEYLIGNKLSNEWVQSTLELTDTSKYFVSDFEKSPLYDNEYTYIYNAAIRSSKDDSDVVGGIGIVFDSKVQFAQMIEESLPKQNNKLHKNALFSVLTTQDQTIIASNNSELLTGDMFHIDRKFFLLNNGESLSEIIEYNGNYYALGVKCSKGYREYKSSKDDYENNVYNFVFSYISNVAETHIDIEEKITLRDTLVPSHSADSLEVATFMVGSKWLGVKTQEVVESVNIVSLNSSIKMEEDHHFKGTMVYKDSIVSVIDIQHFIQEKFFGDYEEIIILKFGEKGYIGILASSLGSIPSVKLENIRPLDEYIIGNGTLIQSVVFPSKEDPSDEILSILNIEKIQTNLVQPNLSHMKIRV